MKTIKIFALILALAFLYACSSSDSSGSAPGPTPGPGPGPTPVVSATFISSGGAGGTSSGGNGGSVDFDVSGDVQVNKSGSVDTSFTVPTYAASYGANKLTISATTVVGLDPVSTVAGDVYLKTGDQSLYYYDTSEHVASGLEVQAGFTLTLPANYGYSYISLSKTVTINGTVTTAGGISLYLYSNLLQIGTTGTVTTKPATAGTDGGYIYLYGEVAINQGTIDSSGSAGILTSVAGGAGGGVDFEADSFLYNTGSILAKGGASTLDAGGKGRHIHLFAYYASVFNSGAIDNSGGNGATSGGNAGWNIRLNGGSQGYVGSLIIGGSLLSNGGTGGTGNGGHGGYINFDDNGGKLWSNATINLLGGSSTEAVGGYGGSIDMYSDYGSDEGYGNYVESQGIKLGGNIDLSGGNGTNGGGSGGTLDIENSYSDYGLLPSPAVEMVGYASITMDGGTGVNGGSGGSYEIYTDSYWTGDDYIEVPVGSIVNEVPVSAKGGAGSTGSGGSGGYVEFDCDNDSSLATTIITSNSGAIDISGGAGATDGGYGGWVYMYGYGKLTNSGAINAKGGAGATGSGGSGADDNIELYSSYDIENTGAIDASGGSGVTGGAGSGYVAMYAGGQTRNSAAINAAGGAGTTTGGNGGDIDLFSEMTATSNSGSLSVVGGTGGTPTYGSIYLDWVDVTPAH